MQNWSRNDILKIYIYYINYDNIIANINLAITSGLPKIMLVYFGH